MCRCLSAMEGSGDGSSIVAWMDDHLPVLRRPRSDSPAVSPWRSSSGLPFRLAHVPVSEDVRQVMCDFTGLDDLDAPFGFLRFLCNAQEGSLREHRPIRRLNPLYVQAGKADLLEHPRLAGLEVLHGLQVMWEAIGRIGSTALPCLREIRLHELTQSVCEMIQRKQSITSVEVQWLHRCAVGSFVLPAWITSFTCWNLYAHVNLFSQATHMRHLTLGFKSDDHRAPMLAYIAQLEHLETLRLVNSPAHFSIAEVKDLFERNRSSLVWHHAAVHAEKGLGEVQMCRERGVLWRTVVASQTCTLLTPLFKEMVGLLTGGWDALTMVFDPVDFRPVWEMICLAAPRLRELIPENRSAASFFHPRWIAPLVACKTLRTITLTPSKMAALFGLATVAVLSQLPELREIVSVQDALTLDKGTLCELAGSASLRCIRLEKHAYVLDRAAIRAEKDRLHQQLVSLHSPVMIVFNGECIMAAATLSTPKQPDGKRQCRLM
jgi:hypothetical protein